jgi:hypothetical protein
MTHFQISIMLWGEPYRFSDSSIMSCWWGGYIHIPPTALATAVQQDNVRIHVKMRRVRVTIVAVEKNKYYILWECVCNHSYPACSADAPYCYMWPARLYNIIVHYLTMTRFSNKHYWKWNVFWFSLYLLPQTFLILRRTVRGMIKKYPLLL